MLKVSGILIELVAETLRWAAARLSIEATCGPKDMLQRRAAIAFVKLAGS
jgi:hypothetical protein